MEEGGSGEGRKLTGMKLLAAKGLDVAQLREEVEKRGGWDKVEQRREWRQIARAMSISLQQCEHLGPRMTRRNEKP